MSDLPAPLPASEAAAVVRTERELRRDALKAVVERNPNGKLAAKAAAMVQDFEALEGGIAEVGGESEFAFMICAAVSGGTRLTDWCADHGQHRGVIWAFLAEDEKRLGAYYRAKEGVADEFGDDVVPLADAATPDDLAVQKWRGEARLKMAKVYNAPRFADKAGGVQVAANITVIHESH